MKSTRRSILAALTALIPAAWSPRKPPVTALAPGPAEIPAKTRYVQVSATVSGYAATATVSMWGTDNLGNRFEIPGPILSGEDAELSIGAVDGGGRIKVFR